MTAGLPGAGIGGLFYLVATITLPLRSCWRRVRGRADSISWRHQAHNVAMAGGIIAGLWLAGWLLGFVVPVEMLNPGMVRGPGHAASLRTVIPAATFAAAIFTLAMVLAAVEVAHHVARRAPVTQRANQPYRPA